MTRDQEAVLNTTEVVTGRQTIAFDRAWDVILMWAVAVRPSVRWASPKGRNWLPGKAGEIEIITDDRFIQARARVERTPGFRQAEPYLRIRFVNDTIDTNRDRRVYGAFLDRLQESLDEDPIIVDVGPVVIDDFDLSVSAAIEMLAGCGIQTTAKSILEWCKEPGVIRNFKRGRVRFVRWSDIKARAPQKKKVA